MHPFKSGALGLSLFFLSACAVPTSGDEPGPSAERTATDEAALIPTTGMVFPSVAAGELHSCVVQQPSNTSYGSQSDLWCFGNPTNGQLAYPSNGTATTLPVKTGYKNYYRLAAGMKHTCGGTGLLSPHYLYLQVDCWGDNTLGELGTGGALTPYNPVPTRVNLPGGALFIDIAAGAYHTCGLVPAATTGSDIYCWGANTFGQLGDGTTTNRSTPVKVAAGATTFLAVSAGTNHTCARTTSGGVMCWGNNNMGQLGIGNKNVYYATTPRAVAISATSIAAGSGHTCVVTPSGIASCWGNGALGQLGSGIPSSYVYGPRTVNGGIVFDAFRSIDAGNSFTCARTAAGKLYCWGDNQYGQLGDGTYTLRSSPTLVSGGLTFGELSLGPEHVIAVSTSGPRSWGRNRGQLGFVSSATAVNVPTAF